MDIVVLTIHKLKIKETKKKDKYLDLTTERKKQWNIKETVIPIVIGAQKNPQRFL